MKTAREPQVRKAQRQLRRLAQLRPRDAAELFRFVDKVLDLRVTAAGPRDYLQHAFFEDSHDRPRDAVVWANRGGGKTMLGAAATLLDLLFKPGIQIRILGGSFEQSQKMYEHLVALLERPVLRDVITQLPTQRRVELESGSTVELLSQSHRSVRGTRVHKLRCDEVEEFDPDVWEAAQLVTRSGRCGLVEVRGAIEALSTMHRPGGLMQRLVDANHAQVFKWNAMDVAARCESWRQCDDCALWSTCGGRLKSASGFVAVEDLIQQRQRTSDTTWLAEMLCQRPTVRDCVYANFDVQKHVAPPPPPDPEGWRPGDGRTYVIGGMDFGMRSPLVMLWALVRPRKGGGAGGARGAGGDMREAVVHVIDEHIASGRTLDEHLNAIEAKAADDRPRSSADAPANASGGKTSGGGWPAPVWLGVDPAGHQRNSHSGLSDVQQLRKRGWRVRSRRSRLAEGIELVRRRLDRGTLRISPNCVKLIAAMQAYHFDASRPGVEEPVKDGPDHACDALRYMLVNLEASGEAQVRQWV